MRRLSVVYNRHERSRSALLEIYYPAAPDRYEMLAAKVFIGEDRKKGETKNFQSSKKRTLPR